MKKVVLLLSFIGFVTIFTFPNKNTLLASHIIDPNQPIVALTFDDGPSKYTKEIVEYLHQEGVVATFFVVGNKVPLYQATLKQAIQYGNEIGNHSYSHKWLSKLSDEEMVEEIEKGNKVIKDELNYRVRLIRPTYGGINDRLRKNVKDLKIVFWSVDTRDWKYKNVSSIVKQAKKAKDGDIILMHDLRERTVSALKDIVPLLKEYNVEFVTVSQLEEIKLIRNKMKQK